jgi:hypothetical protein
MKQITSETAYRRARTSFYVHAAVFAIVNLILLIVNLKKSPGYLWIKWVVLDWGVGLATHAWIVFHDHRATE